MAAPRSSSPSPVTWIVAGASLLALAGLATLLLWPSEAAQPADAGAAPVKPKGAERRQAKLPVPMPGPEAAPPTVGAAAQATARPSSAPSEPPSARAASIVEQLVALRAIESQADVSAYLQRNAALAEQHVEAMCRAAEKARAGRPTKESARQRDAAPFLAPLIDWETEPKRQGSLRLPEALVAKLEAAGPGWPTALTPADVAGLDLRWMAQLHGFDHWSLLGAGPMREPNPPKDLEQAIPYYPPLLRWAKVRLAVGLQTGSFAEAQRDVRQLAELLHTQGILIAEMYAFVLQKAEREAYDAAGGGLEVPEPPTLEALEESRRISRYAHEFFYPGVSAKVMQRARECVPSPCTSMMEGAYVESAIGEFSSEDTSDARWPLFDAAGCDRALLNTVPSEALSVEKARAVIDGGSGIEKIFGPLATP